MNEFFRVVFLIFGFEIFVALPADRLRNYDIQSKITFELSNGSLLNAQIDSDNVQNVKMQSASLWQQKRQKSKEDRKFRPSSFDANSSHSNKSKASVISFENMNHHRAYETNDLTPKFVSYHTGETIRLNCSIANGPYLVMWNKLGLDYPLTIGKRRFSPDERIRLEQMQSNRWTLLITNAKVTDSGVYSCTASGKISKSPSRTNKCAHANEESCKTGNGKSSTQTASDDSNEYYVTVVEPELNDRLQVDNTETSKHGRRKQITLSGPIIVFYGTPLELVCRASFESDEAKLNPKITLEWYHRGVRRRPQTTRSGGVYITEKWIDSHILESRLLISWASEADAGQWICLDRSNYAFGRGMLFAEPKNEKYVRNDVGQISLSPMHRIPPKVKTHYSPDISTNSDIEFDRIDVMVIDLPDPTMYPTGTTTSSVPAYLPMNDQAFKVTDGNYTAYFKHERPQSSLLRLARRQSNGSYRASYSLSIYFLHVFCSFLGVFVFCT